MYPPENRFYPVHKAPKYPKPKPQNPNPKAKKPKINPKPKPKTQTIWAALGSATGIGHIMDGRVRRRNGERPEETGKGEGDKENVLIASQPIDRIAAELHTAIVIHLCRLLALLHYF
jgi:hypothetical protein